MSPTSTSGSSSRVSPGGAYLPIGHRSPPVTWWDPVRHGNTSTSPDGAITQVTGFKLVNNSFSVPAASGCGYWPFVSLITAAVNLKEGLPAASGTNTAIFNGNQNVTYKQEVINHTP